MKSAVVATAFVSVALAANSTTTSPLVPSGISSGCSTFLTGLNTDSTLTSCLTSINSATAAFGPTATSSADSSAVTSALAQLCSSTSCDASALQTALTSFYSACSAELVGSATNKDTIAIYDSLYMISPLRNALCAKSNNAYCVTSLSTSSSASKRDLGLAPLVKRDSQVVLKPNTDTYNSQNVAFLRLSASDSSDVLCGDCSKQVQEAWIDAMNAQSYAPGIANSVMFAGQPALYNATTTACGTDFFASDSTVNNVGGGLAGGVVSASGAAPSHAVSGAAGILGALVLAALSL
ncbi:hypothetical protein PENSPDRAFT_688832 [Peniophora sp. CONT]|nr:hypothetical protein PENSPDRAFT_688832 [Peniophora sp. CONT]